MPDGDGYLAAAYLVFLALVLIYVAIMAVRLGRLQRDIGELNQALDRRDVSAERDREAAPV
jgi:HAMP domain-containing protein